MVPEIWSMTDRHFPHFGLIFALLLPPPPPPLSNKKWKQRVEISSFYTSIPEIVIIGVTVPEIWYVTHLIVIFHFGLFFALLPTLQPPLPIPLLLPAQNIKIAKKMKKNFWRYHHFTHVYHKL